MLIHALTSYAAIAWSALQNPNPGPLSSVVLYAMVGWLVSAVAFALWMRRFNTPLYVD